MTEISIFHYFTIPSSNPCYNPILFPMVDALRKDASVILSLEQKQNQIHTQTKNKTSLLKSIFPTWQNFAFLFDSSHKWLILQFSLAHLTSCHTTSITNLNLKTSPETIHFFPPLLLLFWSRHCFLSFGWLQ